MNDDDFASVDVEVGDPGPAHELLGAGEIPRTRSSRRSGGVGSRGQMSSVRQVLVQIPLIGHFFDPTRSRNIDSSAPRVALNDSQQRGCPITVGIFVFILVFALAILFIFWQSL